MLLLLFLVMDGAAIGRYTRDDRFNNHRTCAGFGGFAVQWFSGHTEIGTQMSIISQLNGNELYSYAHTNCAYGWNG